MNNPRNIALTLTTLIGVAAVVLMMCLHLALPSQREWPPRHDHSVAMVDDQFFDIVEAPVAIPTVAESASPSYNDVTANNHSVPEPTTGHDLRDAGAAAAPPTPATSRNQSPVQQQATPPQPTGPTQQELAEAEARRRASSATRNAFDRAAGNNNTSNNGATPGNSGNPNGSSNAFNGNANGEVTGGWVVPRYARIPATTTGSIRVRAVIDRTGRATEITLLDGTPPAGADPALRQAVINEVKARRYTRADNNAPDRSIAIITYTFK